MRRFFVLAAGLVLVILGTWLVSPERGAPSTGFEPRRPPATGTSDARGDSTFEPLAPEDPPPSSPAEPERREERAAIAAVSAAAPSQPDPRLSMRFDRGSVPAAFLRVLLVGGEGEPLAGELAFEVEGLPRRVVELQGRGGADERRVELCVPAAAVVRITAELDGLLADPLEVRAPAANQWLEVRLPVAFDPYAALLELQLACERELEGTRFLVHIRHETAGELRRTLRTPAVRDGRLSIGRLPAGRVALVGQELSLAQAMRPGGLALTAQTHLDPGERALARAFVEPGGSVRVHVSGADPELTERRLVTEIRAAGGVAWRPSWRGEFGSGTKLPIGEPAVLVPSLPPGAATLILRPEGRSPIHRALWIRPGEVSDLQID